MNTIKSNICDICSKICKNYRGMRIHRHHCLKKQTPPSVPVEPIAVVAPVVQPTTMPSVVFEDCFICMESFPAIAFEKICQNNHRVCNNCVSNLTENALVNEKSVCPFCRGANSQFTVDA
jgi:hypothetical protein